MKYNLHCELCTGRRFTAATKNNASCSKVKLKSQRRPSQASSMTLTIYFEESQRTHTVMYFFYCKRLIVCPKGNCFYHIHWVTSKVYKSTQFARDPI